MFVLAKRILENGLINFRRNVDLSLTTILVLVITTSLVGGLVLTRVVVGYLIEEAKQKADVSVYFKRDSSPDQAFELKEELSSVEGVQDVSMRSKEEALEDFVERHKDDEALMQSLAEVGTNPFLASLSIRAVQPERLEHVANLLSGEKYSGVIEKVDYFDRKPVIEKIFDLSSFITLSGLIVTVVFVSVSALITFNTVRLTIQSRAREISVMRLVGASNSFISGPFLVQGFISGITAFVLSLGLVAGVAYLVTPRIGVLFTELRIFSFFKENLLTIALIQLGAALFLGLVPSFAAIRKYLSV